MVFIWPPLVRANRLDPTPNALAFSISPSERATA